MDKGTLYQLKNIINCTSVPTSPDKNMKAAEDFLLVTVHAHIVAAAYEVLSKNPIVSVFQLSQLVQDEPEHW